MLTLSASQMSRLAEVSTQTFINRASRELAETFPREVTEQGLDITALESLARQGVDQAGRYGVVDDLDVMRFLECMLVLGRNFDNDTRYIWAKESLRRMDLDGEAKMDIIDHHRLFSLETAF